MEFGAVQDVGFRKGWGKFIASIEFEAGRDALEFS